MKVSLVLATLFVGAAQGALVRSVDDSRGGDAPTWAEVEQLIAALEAKQEEKLLSLEKQLEIQYEAEIAELRAAIDKQERDCEAARNVVSSHRLLQNTAKNVQRKVNSLEKRLTCIDPKSNANNLWFEGCNVHVRNGNNRKTTEKVNGKGNLIIGYSSNDACLGAAACTRTGSHNLVVGDQHEYLSYGGIVAGLRNKIDGPYASVLGGQRNLAQGQTSTISGGEFNTVTAQSSSILGKTDQTLSRSFQTIPN